MWHFEVFKVLDIHTRCYCHRYTNLVRWTSITDRGAAACQMMPSRAWGQVTPKDNLLPHVPALEVKIFSRPSAMASKVALHASTSPFRENYFIPPSLSREKPTKQPCPGTLWRLEWARLKFCSCFFHTF